MHSGEAERMHFNSQSCDILFLELSGQMSFDKGCLVVTVSQ